MNQTTFKQLTITNQSEQKWRNNRSLKEDKIALKVL